MAGEIYAPVEWRFAIVAPFGVGRTWAKVAFISNVMQDTEMLWQLNRSTSLTFNVPSDDPQVNILHTDGLPFLSVGPRFVLGWRKAPPGLDPFPGGWELKYAGRVWSLQDSGDGNNVKTQVTCFDPLKQLEKRIVRKHGVAISKQQKWWAVPGTQIIKEMVDETQTSIGTCRIDTAGGHWIDSGITTAAFDQAMVMPSITRITDTGTCDLEVEYLDGTNGDFLQLGGKPRLGQDKPGVIMGYAAPPRRTSGFDRTQSLDNLANSITIYGKSLKGFRAFAFDTDSQDTYDVFEDITVLSDIENAELLQLLADEELFLRKSPNDLVSIVPTPEDAPRFFNEYFLGDTIKVAAAQQPFPITRDSVSGLQRVYGARLKIDNEYGEAVTELIASAQAESS